MHADRPMPLFRFCCMSERRHIGRLMPPLMVLPMFLLQMLQPMLLPLHRRHASWPPPHHSTSLHASAAGRPRRAVLLPLTPPVLMLPPVLLQLLRVPLLRQLQLLHAGQVAPAVHA